MAKKLARMVHHIPITKARINLGQVVRRAHLNRECFILEKDGIPVAGIINMEDLSDFLGLQETAATRRSHETDLDDFLTPPEAKLVRKGEAQLKRGESVSWEETKKKLKL